MTDQEPEVGRVVEHPSAARRIPLDERVQEVKRKWESVTVYGLDIVFVCFALLLVSIVMRQSDYPVPLTSLTIALLGSLAAWIKIRLPFWGWVAGVLFAFGLLQLEAVVSPFYRSSFDPLIEGIAAAFSIAAAVKIVRGKRPE